MLLMGHEKVTNIELDGFNSAQNSFMINSSGSFALTNSKIWSKESISSGRVPNCYSRPFLLVLDRFDSYCRINTENPC